MNSAHLIDRLNRYWAADALRHMRGLEPNTLVHEDEYDILGKIGDFHTVLDAGTADLAIIQTLTGWTTRASTALIAYAGHISSVVRFEHLRKAPRIKIRDVIVETSEDLVYECMKRTSLERPHALILTRMLGRYLHKDPPTWPIGLLHLKKEDGGVIIGRLDRSR